MPIDDWRATETRPSPTFVFDKCDRACSFCINNVGRQHHQVKGRRSPWGESGQYNGLVLSYSKLTAIVVVRDNIWVRRRRRFDNLAFLPFLLTQISIIKLQRQLYNEEASASASAASGAVFDVGLPPSEAEDTSCQMSFTASNLSFYSDCKCKDVSSVKHGTCSLSGFSFQPKKDGKTPFTPSFPASSPWVTSVGATQVWIRLRPGGEGYFLCPIDRFIVHPFGFKALSSAARSCTAPMLCALVLASACENLVLRAWLCCPTPTICLRSLISDSKAVSTRPDILRLITRQRCMEIVF